MRYEVDFFATIEAMKNVKLFWPMAPRSSWPIGFKIFLPLTCLTY